MKDQAKAARNGPRPLLGTRRGEKQQIPHTARKGRERVRDGNFWRGYSGKLLAEERLS